MKKLTIVDALPVIAGLVLTVLVLSLFSRTFVSALDFLTGSFTSHYYFGSVLNTAALLAAGALGDAIVLTAGEYNLGGEGQIYAGGFAAAVVFALPVGWPPAFVTAAAFAASLLLPAAMALVSASLRQLKNADVLLTSFLVSAAAIPFIDSLIAGKFRGQTNNLLATPFIAERFRFAHILNPSPLSALALIPLALCGAVWYVKYRTVSGRHLQITGISKEFAKYSGYRQSRTLYATLAAAGALHGLAGFIAVAGTYYTCHAGFYAGMGWNALSCALIANSNPAMIAPAGLVLAWLFTSANRVALNNNFGFDMSSLIQGVMLSCIAVKYAGGMRHAKRGL
ncbi:ABC transporter permease [Treponema sp. Marseille-Q4132]|uniref:ABC transporter permease n=1 Tax=Treponema sp. Marseille-Q4132 TaxID=2766701 RepID=UPI001652D543|nr:ABC transporter permease [Treponema sp. Marseille-Q4132]QNL97240.1 ABC transporter permease [Treponema sp. Marseille-Q4132]